MLEKADSVPSERERKFIFKCHRFNYSKPESCHRPQNDVCVNDSPVENVKIKASF